VPPPPHLPPPQLGLPNSLSAGGQFLQSQQLNPTGGAGVNRAGHHLPPSVIVSPSGPVRCLFLSGVI
jgi:hypothetical protein